MYLMSYFSGVDAGAGDLINCLFVSHQSGQDSPRCGFLKEPCKTLPQALLMASDGGKICLDGRDSESHPYTCEQIDGRKELMINKSLTIQGWLLKAHISCKRSNSLTFKQARNRLVRLTLSNLAFHKHGFLLPNVSCFNVLITNCTFMSCKTAVGILQEKKSKVCRKSSLVISDTEFFYNNKSVFACLFNGIFTLNISRCVFQGKKGRFNGISGDKRTTAAVFVQLFGYVHASGFIADSSFRDLSHEDNGFALLFLAYHISIAGSLSVFNTTFLNNENAISVAGGFGVRIVQTTINSTYGYALFASGPPKIVATAADIRVFLDYCLLSNNRIGIRMANIFCLGGKCAPSSQTLVVKNSLFFGGNETKVFGDAIRFKAQMTYSLHRPPFIKGVVILDNVTFQEIQNSVLFVGLQKNVKGLIYMKNCKLLNNSQFVNHLDERPIVNIEFKEEDRPKCLERNHSSKFVWNNTFQVPVIFENSIFEGNIGISGALNFENGNVTLQNCTFKDNEGLTLGGGHVYLKTGFGSLNIVNSTFLQTRLNRPSNTKQRQISNNGCFLYSESVGPVIITNTSFTANVNRKFYPIFAATKSSSIEIDASSSLQCPPGRRVKLDNSEKTVIKGLQFTEGTKICWINVNYVKLFCEECPDRFYSLQRGLVTGLDIYKGTECLKCPLGASCENGNVKAKDNFWGLNISSSPPSLKFFPCPLEYCSSPKNSSHNTYNGCHGSRTDVLCGKCSNGYSEALYSTLCRKNEKCNDHWFWLATVTYVIVFTIYFLFKPPIFTKLLKQSLWFKKPENVCTQPQPHKYDKKHDSGYLKIIFYFYQVAELVMISSPEKTLHMVPIIPPVIAIFNFQVKTLNGSIGCPFPGLTVVTKELFQCLKFLGTLLSIGFIYAIHRVLSKSGYISTPSLTLYLAVALETLLLGYETLADTTLKLMHCVPIEIDWRLFVDGSLQCWQWWQYLLIAFIVAFIIPLILVLFWGSLMLAKDKVTTKQFLTACAIPLPCLVAWSIRHCRKTEDERLLFIGNVDEAEEIRKVLHGPFREATNSDHGTLYWESVLTGRRLVLLTIHTFATDPMIRFVCLNCACVLILIHHVTMKPFHDRKANIFEGFSLMSLIIICTFSLAQATYIAEGIDPTGPNQNLFHVLQWIEIGLLSLAPLAVCVLVVFAALSQLARLLYHCVRCLLRVMRCRCFIRESSMPRSLLINWDPAEELQPVA